MKRFIVCLISMVLLVQTPVYAQLDGEAFPLSNLNQEQLTTYRPHSPVSDDVVHAQIQDKILSDYRDRMSPEFKIPGELRERTEFWFNIYTKYGEFDHVIHHSRYPWIVFKVVNTEHFLTNGKGPEWLRRDRGNKSVKAELAAIRRGIFNLGRKKPSQFTELEKSLAEKLASVPGARSTVYRQARSKVRSQLGQKDFFIGGLINSSRYLPHMEQIFQQMGLPTELTRLPFVESSFNELAHSKVGASGIWQIMEDTGRSYMTVNETLDERRSPIKATKAAARILRSYYSALDSSWPLAITSYNHGIGNIRKAIRASKSKDLTTIIARYHAGDFKFASANFYTCFLAALYAERYSDLVFNSVPRLPLMEREIVRLARRTSINSVQRITGLKLNELLKYNMDLLPSRGRNLVLPLGYMLHLPPGYGDKILRKLLAREVEFHDMNKG